MNAAAVGGSVGSLSFAICVAWPPYHPSSLRDFVPDADYTVGAIGDVYWDLGSAIRPLWPLTCCQALAEYLNYPMLADKKIVFSCLVENASEEEWKPERAPS